MSLPCFYLSPDNPSLSTPGSGIGGSSISGQPEIILDEDNSRHIIQVLRMKPGEQLQLTDGRGNLLTTMITDDHKKKCRVKTITATFQPRRDRILTLAVSLLKNANRFEWLLEKATEIGVWEIVPLIGERTEKQHFRQDRMLNILVSAMLQSQQTWLPVLHPPTPVLELIQNARHEQRFIAHCLEEGRIALPTALRDASLPVHPSPFTQIMLIGPEGDFSKKEIDQALANHFIPVTLGETRLRTETAGIVAASLLCIG
jgi:16S rRNA (uracil1498-N3)-methyltransferase